MALAAVIFSLTYLVIGLQRIPRLHLGRPAGALLGAVAMVLCGVLDFESAKRAIDLDTILFLLGMMILLAYLELSGFFEILERRIIGYARSARMLLFLVMGSAAALAALFMNDTICLLFTPVVVRVTKRLGLPPVPYLIGLAVAANIGSACTIVGNPQNAFVAVRSGLGFVPFTLRLLPVSVGGLAVAAGITSWIYRRQITGARLVVPPPREPRAPHRWMLGASLIAGLGMIVALALGAPPAAAAMSAAAVVVLAGATRPRTALQHVDWSLLLLFGGLFVVMRAVEEAGLAHEVVSRVAGDLSQADWGTIGRLGLAVTVLSQAVSNVPAVMLFAPVLQGLGKPDELWLALAAFSTLAGNLTIIGSVANVIVFETARRDGVEVSFAAYLRIGIPVAATTLLLAWFVLAI